MYNIIILSILQLLFFVYPYYIFCCLSIHYTASPFCLSVGKPNEKPWLAVWVAWGGAAKCHGKWKRSTCIFGVEDLPSLVGHRELFANKFYYDYQPLTLECLNNWIEHKARCPGEGNFNITYYEKLPYVMPQKEQIT